MRQQGDEQRRGYRRLRPSLTPVYLGLLAVIVFATQFAGEAIGSQLHFAWVSSHGLSIAGRATLDNGFVGHARTLLGDNGVVDYVYFDRYPVFFSATLGALTGLTDDLTTKIWIARQVMLVLFVLTMFFTWALLRRLGTDRRLALAIVALTFSGHMLLYFNEMVHFDHPALMGMMLLLYTIARVKTVPRAGPRRLLIVTLLAVSLGRGFVSWSVLGLWALFEAAGLLWQRERPLAQRLRATLAHDATRMLLLAMAWSVLMVGYNLSQEMAQRDVPVEQTSLVQSMRDRLPGGLLFEQRQMDYGEFTTILAKRLIYWYLPLGYDSRKASVLLLLPLIALVLVYCARQPPPQRMLLLLTACSGVAWLYVMINLAWSHNYTTMHALGFALLCWLALLGRLRRSRLLVNALLLLALALFLRANLEVEARNSDHYREATVYTEDYNRILRRLGRSGHVVYAGRRLGPDDPAVYTGMDLQDEVMNAAKYALSFYLGDNIRAGSLEDADHIVATREFLALPASLPVGDTQGLTLWISQTPDNDISHLFDMAQAETRFPPQDQAARHNFGGELALGHYELRDSVQVRPCQRILLESWWQPVAAPVGVDYVRQLAMTDADGRFLASSGFNGIVENRNAVDWTPDHWYLHLHALQIPCDTQAGDYSLIFTVFDPTSNAASDQLPLLRADGSAGDTWLYLTTVFVR